MPEPSDKKKKTEIKLFKAYHSLEDVIVVEEDGRFKMYAMVEDVAQSVEEMDEIVKKLEFTFKISVKK